MKYGINNPICYFSKKKTIPFVFIHIVTRLCNTLVEKCYDHFCLIPKGTLYSNLFQEKSELGRHAQRERERDEETYFQTKVISEQNSYFKHPASNEKKNIKTGRQDICFFCY
jgi:hypothetical protein